MRRGALWRRRRKRVGRRECRPPLQPLGNASLRPLRRAALGLHRRWASMALLFVEYPFVACCAQLIVGSFRVSSGADVCSGGCWRPALGSRLFTNAARDVGESDRPSRGAVMWTMVMALLAALLSPLLTGATQTTSTIQPDVDRLVRAAERLTGTWPSQPPPAIPEVAVVARHGRAVVPLLWSLLSDDPHAQRDRRRWKVQQQVALTLSRIYAESPHCGRSYCDGDPPERIGQVRQGWLRVITSDKETQARSVRVLLDLFKGEQIFWRQYEFGKAIAAANDRGIIAELEPWPTHDDRHVRGNVAFVLARLGDSRGFRAIADILADRSVRSISPEMARAKWSVQAQIRDDRYYAVHLLGDLKDPRGVDLLIPLLDDKDVDYKVAWALAEIGDRRAIEPLIGQLDRDDPSARVPVIQALETLMAGGALPRLRELVKDDRRSRFGNQTTVAEVARHAIAVVSQSP